MEVRNVFVDISKPVDKVWYDCVIFKLTPNSISGNSVNLLSEFLNERKQQVVLNGNFLHGQMSMLMYFKVPFLALFYWFK